MEKELLKLQNLLEGKEIKFDVLKKVVRFSLVNSDSGYVFSEFYNFENNADIISFLRNVIIPSAAISILTEDNGELIVTIEGYKDFLKQLRQFNAEETLINDCENFYEKLERINTNDDKKIVEIIEEINFEFSEGHMIILSVEYAKDTQTYLKNMYQDYKKMKEIDVLEKELANINLCMGGFKDICKNIEIYKDEVKEKLLDKLPY